MQSTLGKYTNILLVTLLVLWMAACGRSAAPPTPQPAVELRLISFDELGPVQKVLIEQFEGLHSPIMVKVEQYRQEPLNYLTDPKLPDLMAFAPSEQLKAAIDQGQLTDISELWQEAGLDEVYPANLRALSTHNGKQYIYPLGYTWNAIYYNKKVFAQYNLQPPTTWDELLTVCDTLLINGETPFALSGRDPFMAILWVDYLNLRLNGPAFHRQISNGGLPYTDAQFGAVFATWRSLVERGYFVPNASTLNTTATLTALARNQKLQISDAKAVMALTGPAFMADLPEVFRDELDFFPFPSIDPSIPSGEVVFAIGYLIPSAAAHRSEALLFLNYLASPAARSLLSQDATSASLFVPAFVAADEEQLAPTLQQGMGLVQGADEVLTPLALDLPSATQFALAGLLRQLLADPQSGKPFNLEAALEQLEAARQKE